MLALCHIISQLSYIYLIVCATRTKGLAVLCVKCMHIMDHI